MFTIEFDYFDWLLVALQTKKVNFKFSQFSRFLLRSGCAIVVQIRKWQKLLFLFHSSKIHLKIMFTIEFDHFDWLLVVLESNKIKFKISQFSRFLLRSGYVILIKIWKWLKLLSSVSFIKKTRVNHVYNRIWLFWLTFSGFTDKEGKLQI